MYRCIKVITAIILVMCFLFAPPVRTIYAEQPLFETVPSVPPVPSVPFVQQNRYARVVTDSGTLNMRETISDDAKVLGKIPRGSIVRILNGAGDWTEVVYKNVSGYVVAKYLDEITDFPYPALKLGDKGDAVYEFKKTISKLGYISSDYVNQQYDDKLARAVAKLQMLNHLPMNPNEVTAEIQSLISWGMISEAKSGPFTAETDANSGLSVAIMCWDSDSMLYKKDKSVKIKINVETHASGGVPPYTTVIKKSLGKESSGDIVTSPFSYIWKMESTQLNVYAVVTDAAGNRVVACAPFTYAMPTRYLYEDEHDDYWDFL
ncbi:hypothetical protein FACS18948_2690 [Clostridia bacterium]|nr:hypothetical protein FACS18948_2690 [Clostridia bacterium]